MLSTIPRSISPLGMNYFIAQTKVKNSFKAKLKAVGVILVYISLDRGVIMLASKAFLLSSIMACRKESSFYFYFTNGNPEDGTIYPRSQMQTFLDIC